MLVNKNNEANGLPVSGHNDELLRWSSQLQQHKQSLHSEFELWRLTRPFLKTFQRSVGVKKRIDLKCISRKKLSSAYVYSSIPYRKASNWRTARTKEAPIQAVWMKTRLNYFDKIIRFYKLQHSLANYVYKAYLLLELQVNAILIRYKLVPFLFLTHELCFYGIVSVNGQLRFNPYSVVSLFDSVSIPLALYQMMYSRHYLFLQAPWLLLKFLKVYWSYLAIFLQNKMWLLTNAVVSPVLATVVIYNFPNLYLYLAPFQQFTRLYYKTGAYPAVKSWGSSDLRLHRAFKLRLFEYSIFYFIAIWNYPRLIVLSN